MAFYRDEKKKYLEQNKELPKPKTSIREKQTLELLEKFKSKLKSVAEEKPGPPPDAAKVIKKKRRKMGKEYEEEVGIIIIVITIILNIMR